MLKWPRSRKSVSYEYLRKSVGERQQASKIFPGEVAMSQRNVGIFIYDQAEVLDFAGPVNSSPQRPGD